jgi:chaperonin GroEL
MVREITTIKKGKEVKEKLLEGSSKIYEAVKTTLGPYGYNVALTKIFNNPHITKDGVTVAKSINLECPIENIAAQVIKEASAKTAKEAGDGTSSTVIFAHTLFSILENIISDPKNQIKFSDLKKEIEKIRDEVVQKIEKLSTPVENRLEEVALVASNNDEVISQLVGDAFYDIGVNGIVSVADSRTSETYIKTTAGIRLDRSHIISSMMETNKEVYKNEPGIIVTNLDLQSDIDALRVINIQEQIKKPLLVICNDLTGQAAEILSYNKKIRKVPIVVIRGPFISEARKEAFKDLAIATGANFIDKELGWDTNDINLKCIGSCDYFEVDLKETNIIGRKGKEEEIQERINYYQTKIKEENQGLEENYKKRINILNGGAAVIYVGGASEIEIDEKKDRIDDTIRAVKSALEKGVVLGGGVTYMKIAESFILDKEILVEAFKQAMLSIPANILENKNPGIKTWDPSILEDEIKEQKILDPSLVLINTVINGTSAALLLASTNCVIVKKED